MLLVSPDFNNAEMMPVYLSCQGEGKNPTLIISEIPREAKSLVLFVEDPDAPSGLFVHWVLFDVPLVAKIKPGAKIGKIGKNSCGKNEYCPPCPPNGKHRYYFKIFALDKMLNLSEGVLKRDVEKAMDGHVLEKAELLGYYQKE